MHINYRKYQYITSQKILQLAKPSGFGANMKKKILIVYHIILLSFVFCAILTTGNNSTTILIKHFKIKIGNKRSAPKENVWLLLQLAQVCHQCPKNHVHMPCQFGTMLSPILLIILIHQSPDAISNADVRKLKV